MHRDDSVHVLRDIVNVVRTNKGVAPLEVLTPEMRLREDVGLTRWTWPS